MTFRLLALTAALCVLGFAAPASADAPNVPSNDYLDALRIADAFAFAWSQRDATGGAKTVAPGVRAKVGAAALATYFQGTSSPQHWAFEVGSGTLARAGTYRFPVHLYANLQAGGGLTQSKDPVALSVSRNSDGRWYATNLP